MAKHTAPQRPAAPKVNASAIPEELKHRPQWVCWRFKYKPSNGKWSKEPITALGRLASTKKRETWTDFDTALAAYDAADADGIGFVFTDADPYIGIDLDGCLDPAGAERPDATDAIRRLRTYVERSPSGTGLHLIVASEAQLPGHGRCNNDDGREMYATGRYFTFTGDVYGEPAGIRRVNGEASDLYLEWFGADVAARETESQRGTIVGTLYDLPISDDYMRRLRTGEGGSGDRSADALGFAMHCVHRGIADETIIELLIDPANHLAGAALERRQGDLLSAADWVRRYVLDKAHERVAQSPAASRKSAAEPSQWPVPIDPYMRIPVPSVRLDECMPAPIARLAESEGQRLNVDPIAIAGFCLGVCAAVLPDDWSIQMKLKDTAWRQQARLWVAGIQKTGARKTEQLKTPMAPVYSLEEMWRQEHARQMDEWKALPEEERKETDQPVMRRLMVNDATIEKLSDLLADGKRHPATTKLLSVHDELATWFGQMDAYAAGRTAPKDRSTWLSAYEGGPHWIDRVNAGTKHVRNWSVSVMGGIQPNVMKSLLGKMQDEGLPQRFIVLVPNDVLAPDDFDDDVAPDREAKNAYKNIVHTLADMAPPKDSQGEVDRVVLIRDAQEVRRDLARFARDIAGAVSLPTHLRNAAPKWEGLHARLTLLFHCIGLAQANEPVAHADKAGANREAATLAANFIRRIVFHHARRFYIELLDAGGKVSDDAKWLSDHILARPDLYQSAGRIERRHVTQQYHFKNRSDQIEPTLETLQEWGWLQRVDLSARWLINPSVWEKFAARAAAEVARRERVLADIEEAIR